MYTKPKNMSTIQITSRVFREKQKDYFEKADNGDKVVIKRGKKQAYLLVPINENDSYFTPQMLTKIDLSIEQAKNGMVTKVSTEAELSDFLDKL